MPSNPTRAQHLAHLARAVLGPVPRRLEDGAGLRLEHVAYGHRVWVWYTAPGGPPTCVLHVLASGQLVSYAPGPDTWEPRLEAWAEATHRAQAPPVVLPEVLAPWRHLGPLADGPSPPSPTPPEDHRPLVLPLADPQVRLLVTLPLALLTAAQAEAARPDVVPGWFTDLRELGYAVVRAWESQQQEGTG